MVKKLPVQKHSTAVARNKEPEYTVHLGDPKMLRKDILESLREIIIFMQGYERFRKIQEEKVAHFGALKHKALEISRIVDTKLKRYFPKGKLKSIQKRAEEPPEEERVPTGNPSVSDLDKLEGQLKEIEGKLQGV